MGRTRLVPWLLVLACSKQAALETKPKPKPEPVTAVAAASATARVNAVASVAPSAASSAAPSAAPSAAAVVAPLPPAEPFVTRWNELHSRRDVRGLTDVYAESVEFYGEKLPKARVLALKSAAFQKAPDYAQSISGLKITKPSATRAHAEFTKSWTQGGKSSSIAAVLELAGDAHGFKVTKETDGPSEIKRAQVAWSACHGAVFELLSHTDDVGDLLKDKSMGLHIGSEPPDDPTVSVAVHQEHPYGWETLWWYDIDPNTGIVKNDLGNTLAVEPARARRVVETCKDAF